MRSLILPTLAVFLTLTHASTPSSSNAADIFRSNGDGALPAYSLTDLSPDIDFDNIAANAVDNIPDAADRLARRHLEDHFARRDLARRGLARRGLDSAQDEEDEDEQQLTYHILNSFGVYGDEDNA